VIRGETLWHINIFLVWSLRYGVDKIAQMLGKADQSPPSTAQTKNTWSCTSTPSWHCLINTGNVYRRVPIPAERLLKSLTRPSVRI
jgi:hypothetical protein